MKVAFTTSGDQLDALMDSRFGRAPKFLIYDLDTQDIEIVDNSENQAAAQGAGIKAAETVARKGVGSLVTGRCGPKAVKVLDAAGIKIFESNAATVAEALDLFKAGKLSQAS